MGRVFHVHNRIMGRDEVLKIVGPAIVERPGVRDRFLREIRAVARLRHPNIVTGYTTFRAGLSLVFAMEYVDGLDLARMVKAKGPMPVGHACYFVHQAALGLQHAHQAGMVHRDIKPSNLMLTHAEGRAAIKVLDFGLAKAGSEQAVLGLEAPDASLDLKAGGGLTLAGQMLGTPDFIAPEQIVDARDADIRADIYSLGCTLYYLLSGRPPFQAKKLADVLAAHRSTDAMPLNLARPDVPVELAAVVSKMMAKKPDRRFQTPGEVAKALVPFFRKRSGASVSLSDEFFPGVAPDAGAAAPGMSQPATAAGADSTAGTWSSLIDFAETAEDSAGVSTAAQPVGKQPRRLRLAVAVAAGIAAVLVVAVILFITWGRLKTIDERTQRLAAREAGSAPAKRDPRSLPEPARSASPADAPPTSPDAFASKQKDPASPASSPKAPGAPPITAGKTPTPPPPRQPWVPGSEMAKLLANAPEPRLSPLGEQVEHATGAGVRYLRGLQRGDGSWADIENNARTGVTSLATLALLAAGEKPDSPATRKACDFLRGFGPLDLHSTYAISLQTMVFSAVDPVRNQVRIAANADWLQRAQIRPGDPQPWPGAWTYDDPTRGKPADNSNTQYALLGLFAASEAGVPVKPEVWQLAASHWMKSQKGDGGWAYNADFKDSTATMTCAGVSSLIVSERGRYQGQEYLQGEEIKSCGRWTVNRNVERGIDWLANHFRVDENVSQGQQWKYYYLYGLERAARLSGVRSFGQHDWYRQGAEELVRQQNKEAGFWRGFGQENDVVATSFALLFLAKGRAPVLIKKLRHGPASDWNNDPDDVRNLVNIVSRDWKHMVTWQVVDPGTVTVPELLEAPILFLNGHQTPEFSAKARQNLRHYVEQGGFIFADACCGKPEFDQGFRRLVKEVFPEEDSRLRPLPEDHPVWRAKHLLSPESHPLWGIEYGYRTAVIYSPRDLSCYWNQSDHSSANPLVIRAIKAGQNIIDYATEGEIPADKLTIREVHTFTDDAPKPKALRVAKLIHAGDWNIAPQAIPSVMELLRKAPLKLDVMITQKNVFPRDPKLIDYPLIYVHGRAGLSLSKDDQDAPAQVSRARGRDDLRRRRLRQSGVRRRVSPVRRRASAQQSARADPARGRALYNQGRL